MSSRDDLEHIIFYGVTHELHRHCENVPSSNISGLFYRSPCRNSSCSTRFGCLENDIFVWISCGSIDANDTCTMMKTDRCLLFENSGPWGWKSTFQLHRHWTTSTSGSAERSFRRRSYARKWTHRLAHCPPPSSRCAIINCRLSLSAKVDPLSELNSGFSFVLRARATWGHRADGQFINAAAGCIYRLSASQQCHVKMVPGI